MAHGKLEIIVFRVLLFLIYCTFCSIYCSTTFAISSFHQHVSLPWWSFCPLHTWSAFIQTSFTGFHISHLSSIF